MYTFNGACGAAEDWDVQDVVPEGEVDGNAAVWAGEAVQCIRGQPGGHEPGVESVVSKGHGHEMKDRAHSRACVVLV